MGDGEESIQKLASGDCTAPGDLTAKWDFAYDGDGTRAATLTTPYINGQPQTAVLTAYYFGGSYEVTGSDVKKYYSFGGQSILRDSTGLQYFLTDHLGSVVAITDDEGTLTSQQRYMPFGGVRTNVGSISETDFGYTGQRSLDSGMGGLMDYKARMYSPYLNHFTQPDTIVPDPLNPQAWNRYSYALNNPIRYSDPSGHSVDCGLGEQYCEAGKLNTTKRAIDTALSRKHESDEDKLTTHWTGLTDQERSILSEGNWQEGGYDDFITRGGVSDADLWHDPLTYIQMTVGGAGFGRAGWNLLVSYATRYPLAGIVSIGSNGLYQRKGFTYFEIKPDWLYTALNKIGLARLVNITVINNQIAQDKPAIATLFNPGKPGPGAEMEIRMLLSAQYIEGTANWLGAPKIFQPATWQWIK